MNPHPSLSQAIGQTFIIAYREDTHLLEQCLHQENLPCEVLRQVHLPEYRHYASIYLCFLNHLNGWKRAALAPTPTLIVEADFVPVRGMGSLPFPWGSDRPQAGFAWLYTCAPQIYAVSAQGYAVGYSTAAVAYVLTPIAAQSLLEFAEKTIAEADPTQYLNWDSTVETFLRQKNIECYVPFRNYGEHGGKPNPEHKTAGLGPHRADVLYNDLAFLPLYAQDQSHPHWTLWKTRLLGRLKGLFRVISGRYLRWKVLKNSSTPWRMVWFIISRQLTPHL